MTSPKERVRANIYKKLLEEEKRKGKRNSLFSLSLFVLGILASSSYQMLTQNNPFEKGNSYALASAVSKISNKNDISIDHFFENNLFDDKKVEINTDELFGLDRQI